MFKLVAVMVVAFAMPVEAADNAARTPPLSQDAARKPSKTSDRQQARAANADRQSNAADDQAKKKNSDHTRGQQDAVKKLLDQQKQTSDATKLR